MGRPPGRPGAPDGGVTQTFMPFALLALTEAPALLAETPTFNDADPGRGLAGGFGVLTHFVLELERPAFKLAETGASIIPAAVPLHLE